MKTILLILCLLFSFSIFSQDTEYITLSGRVYDIKLCDFLNKYTIAIIDQDKNEKKIEIDSSLYFKVRLEKNNNYLIKANSSGYLSGIEFVSTEGIKSDTVLDIIVQVESTIDDFLVIRKPVLYFKENSFVIDSANIEMLNFTVDQMFVNPSRTIKLKVYCNEVDYISIRRGEDAREYIIKKGVDKMRVDVGYVRNNEFTNKIEIINTGYKYNLK